MSEPIRVFISASCEPCQEIKRLIEAGRFDQPDVEMVDLETEEGYPWLEKMNLTRVPAAYRGTKTCTLSIDDENQKLIIECPEE